MDGWMDDDSVNALDVLVIFFCFVLFFIRKTKKELNTRNVSIGQRT